MHDKFDDDNYDHNGREDKDEQGVPIWKLLVDVWYVLVRSIVYFIVVVVHLHDFVPCYFDMFIVFRAVSGSIHIKLGRVIGICCTARIFYPGVRWGGVPVLFWLSFGGFLARGGSQIFRIWSRSPLLNGLEWKWKAFRWTFCSRRCPIYW